MKAREKRWCVTLSAGVLAAVMTLPALADNTKVESKNNKEQKVQVRSIQSDLPRKAFDLEAQINKMRESTPKMSLPGSLFEPWWRTMLNDPDSDWLLRNFDIMASDRDRKWNFPVGLGAYIPRIDTTEGASELKVTAEVPGIDENHLDVTVTSDAITIKGAKQDEAQDQSKAQRSIERRYGSFERTIALPYKVDSDKAQATLKNGILTVMVPKLPSAQSEGKKVSIKRE